MVIIFEGCASSIVGVSNSSVMMSLPSVTAGVSDPSNGVDSSATEGDFVGADSVVGEGESPGGGSGGLDVVGAGASLLWLFFLAGSYLHPVILVCGISVLLPCLHFSHDQWSVIAC